VGLTFERTVTAAGRNQLKNLPLAKLKNYTHAYNIRVARALEKDDVIDAIISARVRWVPFFQLLDSFLARRARMDVCLKRMK